MPEVDQIVGVFGREEIAEVVDRAVAHQNEQRSLFRPAPVRALEDTARLRITPRHYAYLKISEGCDRLCTFCAIPKMRGKHVTKPIEEVIREANELAADGVRELIIVAQDTTYYGMDLYGRTRLAELLRELDKVDGIEWIRMLYAYPEHFTDELIETLAASKKIIPYLDMPLQHINDRVLKRMIRRVDRQGDRGPAAQAPREVARTWRCARRSSSASPARRTRSSRSCGSSSADFKFERVGVFPYSLEPGTPAAKLDGHLPEEVKQARVNALMEVQQQVAFEWATSQVGKEHPVIIDGPDPEFANHSRGRTYADAPDIDCAVRVKGKNLRAGDFVTVKVTAADGYDLAGRAIGQPW